MGRRKPIKEVELEDIMSSALCDHESDVSDIILKTQLTLEALLIEHIQSVQCDARIPFEFPKKCDWLVQKGSISEESATSYRIFNKMRNDCMHIFGFKVDLAKLRELISSLERNGIEFSDSPNNYDDEKVCIYFDGLRGIAAYIGWNILMHQAELLLLSGGRNIFSDS